ncbi:MAG: T9SS type A sorting domain-containing protein [Flavobacteriales bacterium]|nr:T9SS type A sorting domain-containing protein [Flavobacteriales bacterium]
MNTRLLILIFILFINGSGLQAAPIVVSGTVTNNGIAAPNQWVYIEFPGSDTATITDSMGIYTCTINPSLGQGSVKAFFIDCQADSIVDIQNFNLATRNLYMNLSGCPPRTINVGGQIANYQSATRPIWVYFSLNQWSSTSDSTLVDSTGHYFKIVQCQSQGVLDVRMLNCNSTWESDSTFYRQRDSIILNFDYCKNPTNVYTGRVLLQGSPVNLSDAFLLRYKYNSTLQNFEFVDTLLLKPNGVYEFQKDNSDYLLKAMPTNARSGFAPTYYPKGAKWDDPQSKSIGPHLSGPLDIDLQAINSIPGNFKIEGSVIVSMDLKKNGFGAKGIQLIDHSGTVVDFTYADTAGEFNFSFQNTGTYQVWIDQCGIPTLAQKLEISPSQPSITNVVITASSRGISNDAFLGKSVPSAFENLKIYPNPTRGNLILSGLEKGSIVIYDFQWRTVLETELTSGKPTELNTENWEKGFYFLTLESEGFIYRQKIIKQ